MERYRVVIVAACLVVIVGLLGFIFYRKQQQTQTSSAAEAVGEVREPLDPPEVATVVPPELMQPPAPPESPRWIAEGVTLAESDPTLRGIVRELTGHPLLARMLAVDDLATTFVTAVDNLAEGATPSRHVAGLAPEDPFAPEVAGETYLFSAENAGRYDLLTGLLLSLSPEDCVELYRTFYPLLSQSYTELGYPDGEFHLAAARALRHLLDTPTPAGPVVLERKVTTWGFADPELEALSPARKQLLRCGPDNARRIRQWLSDVEQLLLESAAGPR